jgi:hypothetical protein
MEKDPLAVFDFTEEEIIEVNETLLTAGVERDARICICGHSVRRHGGQEVGAVYCLPSKMQCPCRFLRVVVETQDTRDFLRKTVGAGPMHALGRGIQTAKEKGHWVKWVIDVKCDKCGKETPVSPVPVTKQGVIMQEAAEMTALLCSECRIG